MSDTQVNTNYGTLKINIDTLPADIFQTVHNMPRGHGIRRDYNQTLMQIDSIARAKGYMQGVETRAYYRGDLEYTQRDMSDYCTVKPTPDNYPWVLGLVLHDAFCTAIKDMDQARLVFALFYAKVKHANESGIQDGLSRADYNLRSGKYPVWQLCKGIAATLSWRLTLARFRLKAKLAR